MTVDLFDQTSAYTNRMWRGALRRVPRGASVKRVLLLGLGAGGLVSDLTRRFPSCSVTVVEWDPVMADLSRRLGFLKAPARPTVILGDAAQIVPGLLGRFDLVIVDLFVGGKTADALGGEAFIRALRERLEPDGYLLLNAFHDRQRFDGFDRELSRHRTWRFRFNTLALYRAPGNGRIGDVPPAGFKHPLQSRSYLAGCLAQGHGLQLVETAGNPGLRWHFGPLWFERHVGDDEPELEAGVPKRFVIWQRIARTDVPPGWLQWPLPLHDRQNGVVKITNPDAYWEGWAAHAKRHRRRFLKLRPYDIREVPLDAFVAGYHATGKLGRMRGAYVAMLKASIAAHGNDLRLFGAVDAASGRVMAGLAVLDLPDISQSLHLIAYNHPEAEETSVGHGLIDHWFGHATSHGIDFLNFALVHAPGDPSAWKGYSRFKRQFSPFLIRYPLPLVRII